MGCDIHLFTEKRDKESGKWQVVKGVIPFDYRSYSTFAFLAGVRNYDHLEPLSEQRGLPSDSEYLNEEISDGWEGTCKRMRDILDNDFHSYSYLSLKELLEFDYEKTFWCRRITRTTYREDGSVLGSDGAAIAEEGEGEIISYRENLGDYFFKQLEGLKEVGEPEDVRIVFWFDS